jgi:hypothetical protein
MTQHGDYITLGKDSGPWEEEIPDLTFLSPVYILHVGPGATISSGTCDSCLYLPLNISPCLKDQDTKQQILKIIWLESIEIKKKKLNISATFVAYFFLLCEGALFLLLVVGPENGVICP